MKNTNSKNSRRLDSYLVEHGYFDTKNQAQGAILAGRVKLNGQVITKSGTQVKADEEFNIEVKNMPYVSRGAFKLEKAVREFNIEVKDKVCLDVGASTGGFTDYLLQNGAQKVYAIDVGYGQLAWKLRNDERVVVLEKTNIRNLESIDEVAEFAAIDVSFISIIKILENVKVLMSSDDIEIVLLVKPQFEAGRELVPKSGVVKEKSVHFDVIRNIMEYAISIGFNPADLTYSPIKGPAGNIEFLLYLSNKTGCAKIDESIIKDVVDKAHENL